MLNITNTVNGIAVEKLFANDLCIKERKKIRRLKKTEYKLNDPLPSNFCSPIYNADIGDFIVCATKESIITID